MAAFRTARALASLLFLVGCEPTATVGSYLEAGSRCDPLSDACGAMRACVLDPDPTMDGCRPVDGVATGEPCGAVDACGAGTQCAAFIADEASVAAEDVSIGICAAVCARDAPRCALGERCVSLRATTGIRLDYGVCGR